MSDVKEIRERSISKAKELGYPINENLPLLEDIELARSLAEAIDRCLAMQVVAACAYGFSREQGITWLKQETQLKLTEAEHAFLESGFGDRRKFMFQIEGLYALAWGISIVQDLNFSRPCPQDLVTRFPDIKKQESSNSFRESADFRSTDELRKALDLAYCLHWAVRQASLDNRSVPGKVESYVIVERRRALEWLFDEQDWEFISLDT
jgi:hypothetical protein